MNEKHAERAVIVFAHGSRDPLWRTPVEAVASRIAQLDQSLGVACAYLEMTQPDLIAAADVLIAQGATSVTILPLFIGVGKHARDDLPRLVQQLSAAHPEVRFEVRPAVGEDSAMIEAMARLAIG
ncbi:MAG: CbiX/SirB N-terminal domain-containing protein [Burkholderiales bacterium]